MNSTLTIRTNKTIKEKASKILSEKGLNLSIVLNMYLRKIVGEIENDISFEEMSVADFIAYKKAKEEKSKGEFYTLSQIKKDFLI